MHELQVLVDKLKAVKIELPKSYQIREIIANLLMLDRIQEEDFPWFQKNFFETNLETYPDWERIEERNKSENSYEGTLKANDVKKKELSRSTN